MDPIFWLHLSTWAAGLVVATFTTLAYRAADRQSRENRDRDVKFAALDREYRTFLAALPVLYVQKDDYRRDIDDIKAILKDIREEVHKRG